MNVKPLNQNLNSGLAEGEELPLIFITYSLMQVPEKKLKMVMADKELYKVCAVEVKRQIWQDNQALFGDEVSPLLKQYIVEKEAALFSSDLSILHNFFSTSPKTRRQGEVSHSHHIRYL